MLRLFSHLPVDNIKKLTKLTTLSCKLDTNKMQS